MVQEVFVLPLPLTITTSLGKSFGDLRLAVLRPRVYTFFLRRLYHHCPNDLCFLLSSHSSVSLINGDNLVDYITLLCVFFPYNKTQELHICMHKASKTGVLVSLKKY